MSYCEQGYVWTSVLIHNFLTKSQKVVSGKLSSWNVSSRAFREAKASLVHGYYIIAIIGQLLCQIGVPPRVIIQAMDEVNDSFSCGCCCRVAVCLNANLARAFVFRKL